MIYNMEARGTQAAKPQTVEVNEGVAYIRSKIRRETRKEEDRSVEEWAYEEVIMTSSEYDQFLALNLHIPDGQWTEGLQEAARMARYIRWDGAEQSARRHIEMQVEVPKNKAKLQKILQYKQAVSNTRNQKGYPQNEPEWPKEPVF